MPKGKELLLVEAILMVDDDVGEAGAGQAEHPLDAPRRQQADVLEVQGRGQQAHPARMHHAGLFQHGLIHEGRVEAQVGERVRRLQVEQGGQVADARLEIHQGAAPGIPRPGPRPG